MNLTTHNKQQRLQHFRALYEQAKQAHSANDALFERHMKQYRGSDEIDGSTERASTVRNITYEIVESQVSSTIPQPKVDPVCYTERRDRASKAIERLCASVRDRLPFEEMNDRDERYTYVYGSSVWFAEWDQSISTYGERGGVRIHCLSPRDFIPQPGITRIEHMDYCFLRFATTRAELCRTYGADAEEVALAAVEPDADLAIEDEQGATVIVCFYRDAEGVVGQFIFSGELTLADIEHYYRRKIGRQTREQLTLSDQTHELVYRTLVLENGIPCEQFFTKEQLCETPAEQILHVEELQVPYYTPNGFPIVLRKNTSGEDSLYGQSDCEFIRPEQQAINKIESRILQKLLRAGVTPIVPEDATVALNNAVFGQVIKMKPGESASQYGTVDTTPDISQDIAEAERLYLHAKRTLGISDAYQGIPALKNESGYARQLQISQASGRLDSKRTMKQAAYAAIDRLIFEYYLAYADEGRHIGYRDSHGRVQNTVFRRYDFLERDAFGAYHFSDAYLFSIDLNGGIEGRREQMWEKNLQNLTSGALGDPHDAATLLRYWQSQERAHYPFARENVEHFRELVKATEGEST